jgi:hypothetical protein
MSFRGKIWKSEEKKGIMHDKKRRKGKKREKGKRKRENKK